jgi:RimJ/RimL family protein N-acetyltransferase
MGATLTTSSGWDDFLMRAGAPTLDQVLHFCAEDPVERVFLEDIARRGLGRFSAVTAEDGRIEALCHVGANVVPSGSGCGRFAADVAASRARMVIGEERAVSELWEEAASSMPQPREDRPGQPVYALREAPAPGETELRAARLEDLPRLVPACAAAHLEEIGVDPLQRDAETFRWRTRQQIEEGRSWLWEVDGVIRFKAEASAWTPEAVQLQQVWVDPQARGRGYARRALSDLCRLLLAHVPTVCLFVRPENSPALRLYDAIGMTRELTYRSLIF